MQFISNNNKMFVKKEVNNFIFNFCIIAKLVYLCKIYIYGCFSMPEVSE